MNMQTDALASQLDESRSTQIERYSNQAPYVDRCNMRSNEMGDITIIVRHINFDVKDDNGYAMAPPKNVAKVVRSRGYRPIG